MSGSNATACFPVCFPQTTCNKMETHNNNSTQENTRIKIQEHNLRRCQNDRIFMRIPTRISWHRSRDNPCLWYFSSSIELNQCMVRSPPSPPTKLRQQRINSIYRTACTKVCNKIVTNTHTQQLASDMCMNDVWQTRNIR